jgi:N-ethylmaleimide reductase
MKKLLTPYQKNGFRLKNHIVMAPMTRSRAIDNIPNDLMAEYYGQRTGAGLIVTEGTAPSPEALGYPRIPGIFSDAQIEGWRKVTKRVRRDGSKIFVQLMHTGRIAHTDNLPDGTVVVGPSNRKAAGLIFTDTKGLQDHSEPTALTTEGVRTVIESYVQAAKNAIAAGFDGVEVHAANGYLPEQFLNPNVNDRTDEYGGSMHNRARFTLEVTKRIASAIGSEKVGIRFSPFSTLGDLQPYSEEEVHITYAFLIGELDILDIAYIHISSNPNILQKTFEAFRSGFTHTIILSNGLNPETAEATLNNGMADVVAFGRSFLANPDFVRRIELEQALNMPDYKTLYTPGSKGYVDYPTLSLN